MFLKMSTLSLDQGFQAASEALADFWIKPVKYWLYTDWIFAIIFFCKSCSKQSPACIEKKTAPKFKWVKKVWSLELGGHFQIPTLCVLRTRMIYHKWFTLETSCIYFVPWIPHNNIWMNLWRCCYSLSFAFIFFYGSGFLGEVYFCKRAF